MRPRRAHRWRTGRSALRLLLASGALALLVGCGGGGGDDGSGVASLGGGSKPDRQEDAGGGGITRFGGGGDPEEAEEAMLAYARCMREQGIDFPDPDPSGLTQFDAGPVDPEDLAAAQDACKDEAPSFEPPSKADQERIKEELLQFARCMREHGIDLPDPDVSAEGGAITLGEDEGDLPDLESPEFKAAQEACREFDPMADGADGGSGEGG